MNDDGLQVNTLQVNKCKRFNMPLVMFIVMHCHKVKYDSLYV